MDQSTLVTEHIEDGRRLVERLIQEGIGVTAACWLKTEDDGEWSLYIASPLVDEKGRRNPYGPVYSVMRQLPQPFWVHPFDVKLISPKSPIARMVLDLH